MLPAVIVSIVIIGVLVSSFQVELGLMKPGKGERAALAAVAGARDLSSGDGAEDYAAFSQALLAATVAQKTAAPTNAADTRVDNLLAEAIDCLYALREAWQAEIESTWDPQTYGTPSYWNVLHPALRIASDGPLSPADVRRLGAEQATELIEQAAGLTD